MTFLILYGKDLIISLLFFCKDDFDIWSSITFDMPLNQSQI